MTTESEPKNPEIDRVTEQLKGALNIHGFSFQYSVIKEVQSLLGDAPLSDWQPWVHEFPVEVQKTDIHIDFILKHKEKPAYLVCECKRANPSLSDWCFVKAKFPLKTNSPLVNVPYMQSLKFTERGVALHPKQVPTSADVTHIGFDLKNPAKRGDNQSPGRNQIDTAVTQVCRGLNGFMQFVYDRELAEKPQTFFLPVIFTTATLWVSSVDLTQANLETGELNSIPDVKEVDMLWYFYHQSQSLQANIPNDTINLATSLQNILIRDIVKPIAIVSAKRIDKFLATPTFWDQAFQ